ncbi:MULTISPECIES: DUF1501 domain-containing protein [unclassified Micromonospora]|uniref:DUF1501 domain-containing protein n=1 Tax=unclassified Micromonospora TaxID=2617518 RepID=UPI001C227F96|nr:MULTISPECIES: DUF1501 domain-containing protein [unclassified Micromonospora]MBU8861603.1 DUF1501 domain-containing protein [Micromonospora sp. WMMB482]MDM4777889.1 DUF1501 domain-containing protein [Micromonospora sp. b486]MDM4781171.1 DUF1501 domain-containing protein [Micromonospora sp. b486]
MDILTRRRFLVASGVAGAAALAAGAAAYRLEDLLATAGDRDPDVRTLVLVTLYGGNDGLNTVVPYADPAYHDARPELAYAGEEVRRLDDEVGLNPALAGLHSLYGEGRLAVVRGVGYPKPDRSHFRSMDIWHTAEPERPGTTGWVGRWLDRNGGDPRLAVSFEPALPPLLAGERTAGASVSVSGRTAPRGLPEAALGALAAVEPGESAARARAAACFADLRAVDQMIRDVRDAAADEEGDEDAETAPATATGGARTSLDTQLDLAAECIEAGVTTRVFSVSLGGFDTHADEKQLQEVLLGQLDRALTRFAARMARTDAGRKVVVAVYSEFGRRVRANGSDGTDHGTASNVLLLGSGVRGGLHGDPPSLTDLDRGDLKFTADFRDVYATLLESVLDTEPESVLGGWRGRLTGVL